MSPRARRRAILSALVLLPLALLASTFLAAPLPMPAPLDVPAPTAAPPPDMTIHQLPTGITHRSAGFAYRGGSFRDRREFVMTAALVKHPRGDVMIDAGFARDIDAHFALMPFYFRAITRYEYSQSAAEQLDAAGYDRRRLHAIVLTHAHWDHVSGVADFPGTPVWVPEAEHQFIADGGSLTAVARSLGDVEYRPYSFDGGPYLGFPASHDVHGDGAIVIVPAFGHTPGSVIVFVTLPDARRYAFVGDSVWQTEGITEREERPWLQRSLADVDAAEVRVNLLRMAAIAARFPELTLVPAHDARGFADIPRL